MQTAVFFVPLTIVDEYGNVWECMGKSPPANGRECGEQAARILLPKPFQNFSNLLKNFHAAICNIVRVCGCKIWKTNCATGKKTFLFSKRYLPGKTVLQLTLYLSSLIAACAAARRAIGTR